MSGFHFADYSNPKRQQVTTDTGLYLGMLAPQVDYDAIISKSGAKYNGEYNVLPCNTTGLPDMIFTINGNQYTVPSSVYVKDVRRGSII